MNINTSQTIRGLFLLIVVTSGIAANVATAQNTKIWFQGNDGCMYTITQNGPNVQGTIENQRGKSTFTAKFQAWTVRNPNGIIVEKSAYLGRFNTLRHDGGRLAGRVELRSTPRPNIVEFRAAADGQPLSGAIILTQVFPQPSHRSPPKPSRIIPQVPLQPRSVTTDRDEFSLLPKEDLKKLGL